MKKNRQIAAAWLLAIALCLGGCTGQNKEQEAVGELTASEAVEEIKEAALPDGVYTAEFDTDNSMFSVNEAHNGRGILTVEKGEMTLHVSLASKNIVNLYPGLAEDAEKEGALLLEPTLDSVTYSDGWTDEVYGFDIPVPWLDEEFDLALVGTKGKWYDHKVRVSDPQPLAEAEGDASSGKTEGEKVALSELAEGSYTVELTFEGGTGRARILSPAALICSEEGMSVRLEWNSPNYDYMLVEGEKYLPVNREGNSVFEIPLSAFDQPIEVIGDTLAMSTPHEVEYILTFHSDTIKKAGTGLVYEGSVELSYAENFSIDYYEGGYRTLTTMDGTRLLVVPEGNRIPEELEEGIIVLQQPLENVYLVSSSVMNIFCELDALNTIRLSGQKEENWYIPEAKEAMKRGDILYAGKYSKPDYELILSENCSLAIENMMISHSPEVIQMLEDFGIPVLIEYSSYESHPLGRVEWVKFFGTLAGKEKEAEELFARQEAMLKQVEAEEKTDKTVAFFFITSNGLVQVRQSADYIPKMIELAGGKYIFEDIGDPDSRKSTMNMQIEEFYHGAKDADFLIYNSSIDGGVGSVEELLDKCALLEDFQAVQEGNVWCTTNDMYQQSMSIGGLIEDIHAMLLGEGEEEMEYLFRLE